jgi:monoterpene epsilon-lactone hydrolase
MIARASAPDQLSKGEGFNTSQREPQRSAIQIVITLRRAYSWVSLTNRLTSELMANPEIVAIRAMFNQDPLKMSTAELRAGYDALGAAFPLAKDVELRAESSCSVPSEWGKTPGADSRRVLLYLHGGGYVIGSLASHRNLVAELGRAALARTFAIDYRLAPEAPFPAAVDDALAAYRFLLGTGIQPREIAIAGDSAGGGLTVATLVAARDAGLPQPACAVCISPWVDLEMLGASMTTKASEDPLLPQALLTLWAKSYLNGASARTPLAAPLHAKLTGLAPLLIQVGSAEVLLDDSIRLAGAASAAEVSLRLEAWPEMLHVWHLFHPILSDARSALKVAGDFVREHMNRKR